MFSSFPLLCPRRLRPAAAAWLLSCGLASGAHAIPEEARALVDHARAYRGVAADSVRARLETWFFAREAELPLYLRQQLGALRDLPRGAELSDDDLCLEAALLHALGTDPRFQDEGLSDSLYSAASALAQEAIFRFWASGNHDPLDSLRAAGDPSRLPPETGVGTIVAPSPLPAETIPTHAYLEKGAADSIRIPTPPVDWYVWLPGVDRLAVRGGGELYTMDPESRVVLAWGAGGGYDAPPPDVSYSGEYAAAVDGDGVLRLRRFGVAARDWWAPVAGLRPTAFAFSPDPPRLAAAGDSGRVALIDVVSGAAREIAVAGGRVTVLDWSPDGTALAWDVAGDPPRYRAGSVVLTTGQPALPTPEEAGITLKGVPEWAPTSRAALATGLYSGRPGLWLWDGHGVTPLASFPVNDGSAVLVSPDFSRAAVRAAPDPHPQPWGWNYVTPFAWDHAPVAVYSMRWATDARLDVPSHGLPDLCWSGRADWIIRRIDERAETLDPARAPHLRRGLWALNLNSGEDIPLTLDTSDYRLPRLSGRQTWLVYLEADPGTAAGGHPRGTLWARPIELSRGGLLQADRLRLRAIPLIQHKRYVEGMAYLRDALRLNPGLNEARLLLAQTSLVMAAEAHASAETGLLLANAVRDLTILAAESPSTPLYRGELTRAFLSYAVVAGRVQAAAAADRARAFLDADPDRAASPEEVRTVLQPNLIDAILWDPKPEDGWRLLETSLEYYRGP